MYKGNYFRFEGLLVTVIEKCKPNVVISISQEKPGIQIFKQNYQFEIFRKVKIF